MSANPDSSKELPLDRLATTDQRGHRVYLYPSDYEGKWKRRRARLSVVLVAIFLGLPWVKIGGHPAVLLDIVHRKFALFGLTFWAHDAPLLFFVLGSLVLAVAGVTAIWGRVWCGWACPQTVFVEQVFRRVERWVEGEALTRRKRDEGPWSVDQVARKSLKWTIYLGLALVIGHSFLAYFVGVEELGRMIRSTPSENFASFLVMAFITLGVLFDFGWFREQFCVVACPYGRFQSVLMDAQSQVVAYDARRGEPRRGASNAGGPVGDCVNCYRCVQVCPTGVDIRRGVQLECVACTACMDACDEVMSRLKKPTGLIRYGTQNTADGVVEVARGWGKRTRAGIYFGLIVCFLSGLAYVVSHRSPLEITLIRAVEAPYQVIGGGSTPLWVLNHFKADLRNQLFEEEDISFHLSPELEAAGARLIVSNHRPTMAGGEAERADLFLEIPTSVLSGGRGKGMLAVEVRASHAAPNGWKRNLEVNLLGPL